MSRVREYIGILIMVHADVELIKYFKRIVIILFNLIAENNVLYKISSISSNIEKKNHFFFNFLKILKSNEKIKIIWSSNFEIMILDFT